MTDDLNVDYLMYNALQRLDFLNNTYCDTYAFVFRQRVGEPFDHLLVVDGLKGLESMLQQNINECIQYQDMILSGSSLSKIFPVFLKYHNLLYESMNLLKEIVERLYKKSRGERGYSYPRYCLNVKHLNKLEERRSQLGDSLDTLAVPFMHETKQRALQEGIVL